MPHLPVGIARPCGLLLLAILLAPNFALAQFETATISGQISDPSGLRVVGARVGLVDIDRGTNISATTNDSGLYRFTSVHPGRYRMEVTAAGFKIVNATGLTVNVQDHLEQNFKLTVGSVSESVTVEGGAPLVDTESATVSTVVDRKFAENLPMNGRSFQTLIELTPGTVLTASNVNDGGQFSVNGQRADANYWMVDGVSANIGIGHDVTGTTGNGLGGALGSFSALGGTNSLVSVDALQEFRIQTSTYAPEFGRTPGGQISIVTRSGTNQFHGTAFDYLRNDVFDANNWFNGVNILNPTPLPKAMERQNDFGGTFSGPIFKDKTFFFFSYEGLRLRLPQTTLTQVPDLAARQNAQPPMQPFLNAFPFDPKQPDLGSGVAQFNSSYSNPATLDAYSIRIDHRLNDKFFLFGRYNYSPSEISQRGNGGVSLNTLASTRINTQTATIGATWIPSATTTNDLRFNFSRVADSSGASLDNFGGAVPLVSLPLPEPFNSKNAFFGLTILLVQDGVLQAGQIARNLQRQINVIDSLSFSKGSHDLKVGVDFRRLSPSVQPHRYLQEAFFDTVASAEGGNLFSSLLESSLSPTLLFRNLGLYAQDTWRIAPRLTLTYGLRWDIDFVPKSISGPGFPAVTGFDLSNVSNLALAPTGTPPYATTYGNFAPRVGVAYQVHQEKNWQTVIRGGFGTFYDLASSEAGNNLPNAIYPFGAIESLLGGTFPLDSITALPPAIQPPTATNGGGVVAFDPHLRLPYTLEWNVALEQSLGQRQTFSASYVGSDGKRLLQTAFVNTPTPNLAFAQLAANAGTSSYNALQVQFQRRLSRGLQLLASYTWSHSIDTGSAGSFGNFANALAPLAGSNRGPSDFDVRHAFSAGVTYDIPMRKSNAFANSVLRGWSLQSLVLARSAPPVYLADALFSQLNNGFNVEIRPDLVPGPPLYLYGSQYPGGRAFNAAAFTNPPFDPNTFIPLRQGNVPRNFLRAFGATQWDFAVHRDFPIHESLMLQFRAEMFNVVNHPNFGPPSGLFGIPGFGLSTQLLGQTLSGTNVGAGALNPLYQIGGPRSIQFALKLQF
jgi:hypothetical protein